MMPQRVGITTEQCPHCGGDLSVMTSAMRCDDWDPDDSRTCCDHEWHAQDGDPVTCGDCGAKGEIHADGQDAWVVWSDDEAAHA